MITYKIKKVILTILTFLFSAICFVCLSFNNYTATAQTVTVSTDIQSLINDFNLSLSSNYGKATYVENYSTAYGDKVNGILLTIKAPSRGEGVSNGFYNSGVVKLNSIYNIKNMTGNENAIASVIFSVSECPEEINEDTIILSNASIGMSEVNSYKGFDFTFENGLDDDYNYYDTIEKPEVSLGQRI